ncbi:MAG: hypothetical protein IT303_01660 [Dehalococcoidia bacterium]|nr:hypothetical protein [Dehalococcoidia bacterium]
MSLPEKLQVSAWTGHTPSSPAGNLAGWATGQRKPAKVKALRPPPDRPWDWTQEAVGWGVVLFDDPAVPAEERHTAAGAPECIRELVSARGDAPVFRWGPGLKPGKLRRYAPGGGVVEPLVDRGGERGIGPGKVPWFLLIVADPKDVPWDVQYYLNLVAYTGRLWLEPDGMERYVAALLSGWKESAVSRADPVLWSTDHGSDDITWLMRKAIGEPLAAQFAKDTEVTAASAELITGPAATTSALAEALAARKPALIATTSHGLTEPVDRPDELAAQLGLLVDSSGDALTPGEALAAWQPDGAIWYAHACCSAGSAAKSRFSKLVKDGSEVQAVLDGVAAAGERIAPFPAALLGAAKPLRAFIGHVEPTFDWTLRSPENQQVFTGGIRSMVYNALFGEEPSGYAGRHVYGAVAGQRKIAWDQLAAYNAATAPDAREAALSSMLLAQLVAHDRENMVILGDPTAAIPAPQA